MGSDETADDDREPPGSRFRLERNKKTRDPSVAKREEKLEEELS